VFEGNPMRTKSDKVPSSPLKAPSLPTHQNPSPPADDSSVVQVGSSDVESLIEHKRIGIRIRALRQRASMGLVELGRHTGLSASFLSQLETGRVVPTLRNLARIAMVFSKDLNYFFNPTPQTVFRVHRAEDRVRLPQSGAENPNYFFESLGYLVPDRQLDPYLAEFQPGKGPDSTFHKHGGFEFLYVMRGALSIQHGDLLHELRTGDSVYFDSTTSHSYSCTGNEPATVLIVTLQQPTTVVPPRTGAVRSSESFHSESPNRPPKE
jgi:transcriptional regulator with XRE-family HTH domain